MFKVAVTLIVEYLAIWISALKTQPLTAWQGVLDIPGSHN
jgi:hypothetical protein